MSKSSVKGKLPEGAERRRSKRMDILASFSLYVVVPKKGPHRLPVHDLSDGGVGFDLDIEEEEGDANLFPVQSGSELELHLYLNQSLYIPLRVIIRRLQEAKRGVRRIGAEFPDRQAHGHMALLAFLDMLDAVAEAGVVTDL
jgi:c-di-GMP-binding flagellar brake protein YcgR